MPESAVLFSGGLDSSVLLAGELAAAGGVVPLHVLSGFAWEPAESRAIARLLALPPFVGRTHPAVTLTVGMQDVYPTTHWALTGQAPAYDAPDEDVFLEGRNLTLIAKAAVLCAQRDIGRLVLGPLAGNPFPDARPEFFDAMARAATLGLAHPLAIEAPFLTIRKADVLRRGQKLGVPLEATLSCIAPVDDNHCGRCNKCRERQEAFREARVPDRTEYAAAV
jgi:7-cyano-7-deazaguanine synthase